MATRSAPVERTTVRVEAVTVCPFSIAEAYATEYLRDAEIGGRSATIRVPGLGLKRRVAVAFALHLDVAEEGRLHDEIWLRWRSGSRLLPDFSGTIRFRIENAGTRISIVGSYSPPLGPLGRWFDRLFGRRIAQLSLQDLADRLAARLAERERSWRAGLSPANGEAVSPVGNHDP